MKYFFTILSITILSTHINGQSRLDNISSTIEAREKLLDEAWFENEKRIHNKFDRLEKKIQKVWDRIEKSTRFDYVTYTDDAKGRTKINFKKGIITIEVIEDEKREDFNKDTMKHTLTSQLDTALKARDGNNIPFLGTQVSQSAVDKGQQQVKRTTYNANDGRKKIKYTMIVFLKDDHLSRRARQYSKLVLHFANKYNLDPAMILAIMEAESCFNPYADNGLAYGLMQVVPKYGGKVGSKKAYGKEIMLPPHKLKKPEINVEVGCALLWTYYNYKGNFKSYYKKKDKQDLMCIAAYNCGAGRIAKWVKNNPAVLNNTYETFWQKLHKLVPPETKGYIKKVPKKRTKYKALVK
jgi:membrane-bound lytic murein transglycosylase C